METARKSKTKTTKANTTPPGYAVLPLMNKRESINEKLTSRGIHIMPQANDNRSLMALYIRRTRTLDRNQH